MRGKRCGVKEKIICGLDVGSGNVCAVIAGFNPQDSNINIMGVGVEDCSGLKHGVVVNIENTSRAIALSIEKAEKEAEVKVKDVLVNINGNHIEGHIQHGATKISRADREITEEDVERVISSARAVPLPSNKQIIHAIPLDFKVDNQDGVEDPIGMEGNHLEVEIMLITGDIAPINNLDKCIVRAGFGVKKVIVTQLASAEAVVAREEKELGCVLVDIGAQVVNIAIFIEGKINRISEMNLGSDYITYDLAHGLRTSFAEAKRIKESCGSAEAKSLLDTEIKYVGVDGQTKNMTTAGEVNRIICPRLEDIIDIVGEEIAKSQQKHLIPGGIILAGGGSELRGIAETIKSRLGDYSVRLGRPRGIVGKADSVNYARFATAVGLIAYAVRSDKLNAFRDSSVVGRGGFWERIKNWFEDIF